MEARLELPEEVQSEAEGAGAEEEGLLVSCCNGDGNVSPQNKEGARFLFLLDLQLSFLVTIIVKIRISIRLLLFPQEYLDDEEADFQRRAWGKGTPALPITRGPFVPLLPVAMVTREQDPSLLFSLNPTEGGHASANEMKQRGPDTSLQRVHGI